MISPRGILPLGGRIGSVALEDSKVVLGVSVDLACFRDVFELSCFAVRELRVPSADSTPESSPESSSVNKLGISATALSQVKSVAVVSDLKEQHLFSQALDFGAWVSVSEQQFLPSVVGETLLDPSSCVISCWPLLSSGSQSTSPSCMLA